MLLYGIPGLEYQTDLLSLEPGEVRKEKKSPRTGRQFCANVLMCVSRPLGHTAKNERRHTRQGFICVCVCLPINAPAAEISIFFPKVLSVPDVENFLFLRLHVHFMSTRSFCVRVCARACE